MTYLTESPGKNDELFCFKYICAKRKEITRLKQKAKVENFIPYGLNFGHDETLKKTVTKTHQSKHCIRLGSRKNNRKKFTL